MNMEILQFTLLEVHGRFRSMYGLNMDGISLRTLVISQGMMASL
jgi:hypothetical protein